MDEALIKRVLPHSVEAEQSVIGAMLMDREEMCIRDSGYSVLPMIVSLTGACGLRILWIFTIFAQQRTLTSLYVSYPVSWIITASTHLICYFIITRKMPKKDGIPDA